ncbi:carbohydrate ABC transporter permease [Jiangella asiatica]|uniref:Carbohydrate ABC transporter permease n=1 Tax=Jiangella asiatica TaxID=2530372 RepID=A0A4R5DN46_9ACTN|nr:carbohydrate ABC transporter permease [Jiangella asiatica]TDE13544.1 carbohydrate ABC transporter permease [Jiangella asiatica]
MSTLAATRPRRRGAPHWLLYPLAVAFAALVLLPVGYLVLVSLQPRDVAGTTLAPDGLSLRAFAEVWQVVDLAGFLRNSLVVSAATAVASSVIGLATAYVLARFRFRGRELFRTSLLAAYTTPGIVVMIPLYVVYVQIQNLFSVQIIGSLPLLVVTYLSFSLPYSIWMLTGYLAALPESIEEAAIIDGAGRIRMLASVVLPLALPAVVVTAVFSFVLAWNDVLFASVLTSNDTRTVGVGMQIFVTTAAEGGLPQWNNLMAAGLVTALPAVVLFIVIQRYLISGLTAGSVKG